MAKNAKISMSIEDACKLCAITEYHLMQVSHIVKRYDKQGERPPAWAVESVEEYTRIADALNKAIRVAL